MATAVPKHIDVARGDAAARAPERHPPLTVAGRPAEGQRDDHDDLRREALATNVARCALEAIAGSRDLDQLARWVTPGVYAALLARVQHAERARRARRRQATRVAVRVRAVTAQHLTTSTDATVVLELGPRVRAVCVRVEVDGSRWRATSVSVL